MSQPQTVSASDSVELPDIYQKAEEIGSVNGLLVQKRGILVAEEYFHGMEPEQVVNIKSASKSILSLLTGIALDRGILQSADQPIGEFFPEYLGAGADPAKRAITIEDLLTMRAGLETTSRENYGPWVSSHDWVQYILDQQSRLGTVYPGSACSRATGRGAYDLQHGQLAPAVGDPDQSLGHEHPGVRPEIFV